MNDAKRDIITGKPIPVRGNDIDTDRIIPARYLRCVTFEGLGEHSFEDDRLQLKERGRTHAFDDPKYADAEVLLVNKNFGCGSSREHAPQAIMRWGKGIKAIVGESFAEIFFGNCVSLGIPCVTVTAEDEQHLMSAAETAPDQTFEVDLVNRKVRAGDVEVDCEIPDGARKSFLEGRWDSTAELLSAKDEIAAATEKLPYFHHWR